MNNLVRQEKRENDKVKRVAFQNEMGIRVRQLREQKKWTQEMLAQEAHINDKYVYDIEIGNKCMSSWVLMKIAKALDVGVECLLVDEITDD